MSIKLINTVDIALLITDTRTFPPKNEQVTFVSASHVFACESFKIVPTNSEIQTGHHQQTKSIARLFCLPFNMLKPTFL